MQTGHMYRSRSHRGLMMAVMLATTAAGAMAIAMPAQAQSLAQAQAERRFDIAAQALPDALVQFAAQSGYQVATDGAVISGARSQAVRGNFAPVQALSQLLNGTGFTFRVSDNIVTIERAPQTSGGAIQLGPVRVEGEGAAGVNRPLSDTRGTYTVPVTTTATGLNLSIRQTPQSVTVLTQQVIEDKGLETVVDAVEHTAGLSINRYESNRGSMFSRGFKIESYQIDGAPSSIDEQWSAGEIFNGLVLYDRVEVLRGADGLMTGTGNPSATINLVRKRADSDIFTGDIAVKAGSWGHYGATVDLSSPLRESGSTRGRFVADYDTSESYIDRLENRSHVLFATIEQDIGDRTLIAASVSHQENHTDRPTWGGLPFWGMNMDMASVPPKVEIVPLNLHRDANPAADWAYWDVAHTTTFVRGEHDFGNGWQVKGSYSKGDRSSTSKIMLPAPYPVDMATGKTAMGAGFAGIYHVDTAKDDFKLEANGEFALFGRKHEVLFGYEASKEAFVSDSEVGLVTLANTPSIFDIGKPVPHPTFNTRNNIKDHEVEQTAVYVAGRFALLDRLNLVLGSRHIDYSYTDHKTAGNSFESNDRVVPYAGLVFDVTRNVSVYTSYTTIFQPQRNLDAEGKVLHPIEGNTQEVGIKAEFFDKRLNATLSVYRMEQDNVAKSDGRVPQDPNNPTGPTRLAYIGVKGVVSEGFEAEVAGEIRPNWHVTAGYSQFKMATASGSDNINTLVPRKQFNLFTTYQFTGDWNKLTVAGGGRWQSEIWTHQILAQAFGVPKTLQEAYAVVDVMARYQITPAWSLQANINNLLNEEYYAPTDDGMQVFWQAPRHVELKLKYQF